jgi:hypothetical protein
MARALELPMYQHFYDGETPPEVPALPKGPSSDGVERGSDGESADFLKRLRQLLGRLSNGDRKLVLHITLQLARRKRPRCFPSLGSGTVPGTI